MSRLWPSGVFCALALLGAGSSPVRAGGGEATAVGWRRCWPSAVPCLAAPPCGPQVCALAPAPRRCGPIRRLLGLCCPRPVVACQPCCPPVVGCPPPPPCPPCAAPSGGAGVF